MAVSTMLADIRESSGRYHAHPGVSLYRITCSLDTYTYHKSWPPPCLTAHRRPKGSLARAHSCTRVTINRSDSQPTLDKVGRFVAIDSGAYLAISTCRSLVTSPGTPPRGVTRSESLRDAITYVATNQNAGAIRLS
ncbi:Uncharacterized protein TCM_013348 [Theobroma cacao]|uniref:Uncharacterized protein n=1 Tax=Theobroma cacao TaxID=3641 RepID=A0A061FWW1_THECC|nr:Uncharacterized protein TCM_013348 [Theobroma cacao]